MSNRPVGGARFRVIGMDCADDAAKIEAAVRGAGIVQPKVSTASQTLTIPDAVPADVLKRLNETVNALGYQLHRESETGGVVSSSYKTALWVVVILNAGFGIVEMVGGFIARSQALKADALDFVGDGVITLLGIVAAGWKPQWRARSALIQGMFLGALGVGVVITTIYHAMTQHPPEVAVMGALGFAALAVNVAAALVLIPHRTGDASARAVWLFTRNDAAGNAAVIVAAALVLWTGSTWPDVVVALVIAGLFLSSSWIIVRDSVNELHSSPRKQSKTSP